MNNHENKVLLKSPISRPKHIRDDSSLQKNQKLKTAQSCRRFTTEQYDKINNKPNDNYLKKLYESKGNNKIFFKNNEQFNQMLGLRSNNKNHSSMKNLKNIKISPNAHKKIQNYLHFFSPKNKNSSTNPYGFKQLLNKNSTITNILSKSSLKKNKISTNPTSNKINKTLQQQKISPFNIYPTNEKHHHKISGATNKISEGTKNLNKHTTSQLIKIDKKLNKTQNKSKLVPVNKTLQNQQFSIYKHRNSNKQQVNQNVQVIKKKNIERAKMYHNVKMKTQQSIISCESTPSQFFTNDIQLFQLIGQGTFGKVYKAKLKKNQQIVAVKKVFQDKKYKNRQIQIISLINNSNFIMKVYGTYMTFETDNDCSTKQYLNIVMKYYSSDLFKQIQVKKILSNIQIKLITYQIFRGLLYLHSKSICHRDIKPHNILVHHMSVAICDFGSAKLLNPLQKNLPYICSRCYRAPQLIFGSTQYTSMIDIWSVGCVILEMIYGSPFFIGDSSIDHLIEVIKVLGTPTKTQVKQMNPQYDLKDYKFPNIKSKSLKKLFPQTDVLLINLLEQILIYAPKQRLNAAQALVHEYFDQLRKEEVYYALKEQYDFPDFFDFTPQQIKDNEHLYGQLVPMWYSKTHETYFQDSDIQKNNILKFYYD